MPCDHRAIAGFGDRPFYAEVAKHLLELRCGHLQLLLRRAGGGFAGRGKQLWRGKAELDDKIAKLHALVTASPASKSDGRAPGDPWADAARQRKLPSFPPDIASGAAA